MVSDWEGLRRFSPRSRATIQRRQVDRNSWPHSSTFSVSTQGSGDSEDQRNSGYQVHRAIHSSGEHVSPPNSLWPQVNDCSLLFSHSVRMQVQLPLTPYPNTDLKQFQEVCSPPGSILSNSLFQISQDILEISHKFRYAGKIASPEEAKNLANGGLASSTSQSATSWTESS